MTAPTFTYLTDVYFAPGVVHDLAELAGKLNIRRPLLVTDRALAASGLLDRLVFPDATLFDAVESNPSDASVRAGVERFRAGGCDGVIAVGGGSPIDCGKCIALMATHPGDLRQYALVEGGLSRITADKPPVVAVPTTAGTGSEVGRGALITFADGAKLAMISPRLIPQAAVCDPELTVGMPAWLTAATGMDAISHCVETYCSPKPNPVADAIALDGLGRATRNLLRVVEGPTDLAARSEMMIAATMGGLTFQKGLGAVHQISHPLGGLPPRSAPQFDGAHRGQAERLNGWTHGLHHGTLNAILLPHVLRFNHDACPDRMDTMARVLGCRAGLDLPSYFERLAAAAGLPARLRDVGVTADECAAVLDGVMRDHCGATNPRPVTRDDAERLLRLAW